MEDRTFTVSFDKAREWYEKGGIYKEFALGVYTEEELTKVALPKTWDEFCELYPKKPCEFNISGDSQIKINTYYVEKRDSDLDRNLLPSEEAAEAHLALMQLHQLRDCYRQGWQPKFGDKTFKYGIGHYSDERGEHWQVKEFDCPHTFLCFQDEATAREFLHKFKKLIKQAGDLI